MENRAIKLLNKIMDMMEESGLKQGEAEWIARKLPERIKENSKRKEMNQPFTVFKG